MNFSLLTIAAGGAAGALLRHGVNGAITHFAGTAFPWGIFCCNVLGCLMMGLLFGWVTYVAEIPQGLKLFLTVGLLGAFTTFSTFSLDVLVLMERGAYLLAIAYILGSVIVSITALCGGAVFIKGVFGS